MLFSKWNTQIILTIFTIFIVSSCGGSGKEKQDLPPIAQAGDNIQIDELLEVSLLGLGSSSDGVSLTYFWEQTAGISVELSDATTLQTTFLAPDIVSDQVLTFRLTVTDNRGLSASDSVNVNVRALFGIVTSTPADMMSDANRINPIVLTFNDPIDDSSIKGAITLSTESGVNWKIENVNANGQTLEIYPMHKLFGDTRYLLTIDKIVKSQEGVSLDESYQLGFTTAPSQWQDPIYFWESGGQSRTAISENGDIVSVHWSYNQSNRQYEIQMVERRSGEWSTPKKISTTPHVYYPDVTMSNQGDTIITWEYWGDKDQTFILEHVDGEWKSPWTFIGDRYSDTTSVNDDGYAVIAGIENSSYGEDRIKVVERIAEEWKETDISVMDRVSSLKLTANDEGEALLVWTQERSTGQTYKIFASTRSEGRWSEPTKINSEVYQLGSVDTAIDGEGNAVVVWSHSNEENAISTWQAMRNEFVGGQWIGEVALDDISKESFRPRAEMTPNGYASIVWEQGKLGAENPVAVSNKVNGDWSLPIIVGKGQYSDIAITGNGEILIFWDIRAEMERKIGLTRCKSDICNLNSTFAVSDSRDNVMSQDIAVNYSGDVSFVWKAFKNGQWYQYLSVME